MLASVICKEKERNNSKIAYINKLDDLVNKYNNTYHRIIKMKPVDVKSRTYRRCYRKE